MLLCKISDGLGNQMFQYACGYAQAKRLGTELVLDATILDNSRLRTYELDKFGVPHRVMRYKHLRLRPLIKLAHAFQNRRIKKKYSIFQDDDPYQFNSRVNQISANTYLSGYWQSEKYFAACREDLLEVFHCDRLSPVAEGYANSIRACNSVSLHVRRSDYVATGICIGEEYYRQALSLIHERLESPVIFVFSDDAVYAEALMKRLGETDFTVVQNTSSNATVEDMMLMSMCRHNIIANSSYSWWGAWLNTNEEKIVVAPAYKQWRGDFYPDAWEKIECDSPTET